jgi:hypothetical protein
LPHHETDFDTFVALEIERKALYGVNRYGSFESFRVGKFKFLEKEKRK